MILTGGSLFIASSSSTTLSRRIVSNAHIWSCRRIYTPCRKPPKPPSSRRFKSNSSEPNKTQWPSSLSDFVQGTPVVTRKLPYFGLVQIDFGTTMMNFGAITSLSGFMMSEVLYLRGLSIIGSLCGVTYNLTRVPKQLNAVAWAGVFITVNLVQIVRLLLDQKEIKFNVEESSLYYKSFQPFGVDPKTFKRLMDDLAKWETTEAGQTLVKCGTPLRDVVVLTEGMATAHGATGEVLYTYTSTDNGQIIGATALADPEVLGRNYPNRIVANGTLRTLSFDAQKLHDFMKDRRNGATLEAALLHMMYVDLIKSLRRRCSKKQGHGESSEHDNIIKGMGMALHDLKHMLQQACADGIIAPQERRLIREFLEAHDIHDSQFNALLASPGIQWTIDEWKDGAKHSVLEEQQHTQVDKLPRAAAIC